MRTLILAIDVGTSACKVSVLDLDGRVLASHASGYEVYRPLPGWAEQDSEDWWRAAKEGIESCLSQGVSAREIRVVGIDGQSWSCVPTDRTGRALARTPIWMDARAADICKSVEARLGNRPFEVGGNPFKPAYATPKLIWMREHTPSVYKAARWFLQSNAYLAMCLTGVASQDVSQGYGLHVFDIRKLCYDQRLADELGIDLERLPPISACSNVIGEVTGEAARETGLAPGTPVIAGGLDAACGTLGAGVYRDGETQEQGGQAGGMSLCVSEAKADPALILSPHVVGGMWLLQGGTVGGGGSLRWLADEIGRLETREEAEGGKNRFEALCALAESVPAGSDGLLFLPYLAGERSPIWDENATGVYFGLDYRKTRGHLVRALLEGAAFALKHNLDVAERAGVVAGELRAMGGAANSRLWTQIKCDVTGHAIAVPDSDAATVRGTAMLAGVGAGLYGSFGEAVKRCVHVKRVQTPDPAAVFAYKPYYELYLSLYERLAPLMRRRAEILSEGGARS